MQSLAKPAMNGCEYLMQASEVIVMMVNGLHLPAAIVQAMSSSWWNLRRPREKLARIFVGIRALQKAELFLREEIETENQILVDEFYRDARKQYGISDGSKRENDKLLTKEAVIIGFFVFDDAPIALDYENSENPRVVYLATHVKATPWRTAFDSVDDFCRFLRDEI